jgi:hypothetical protein
MLIRVGHPVSVSRRRLFSGFGELVAAATVLNAADDPNFTGKWRLQERQSEIDPKQEAPPRMIEVNHTGVLVDCRAFRDAAGEPEQWSFTTDGKERVTKSKVKRSALAKWEGAALLINTIIIVGDSQKVEMDRWTLSRNKSALRIQRQINIRGRETESALYYERAN